MATKTIIRHKPASPLVGRRELTPADFKSIGIFTQTTVLHFDQERNWWLDADAAKVSKEALQWFEDSPEFTVERQEVDEEDPEAVRLREAYAESVGTAPAAPPQPVAGENASESTTTAEKSTTTQSTSTAKR